MQHRNHDGAEVTTMATNTMTTGKTKDVGAAKKGVKRRLGAMARLLLLAAGVLAGACAGSSQVASNTPPPPPEAVASYVTAAPPAPPIVSMGSDVAPAAPAPARNRPGLGTEWGEERESPTHDVAFVRAEQTRPLATTELRYNDERGVEALADYVADRAPRAHESSAVGGAITMWLRDGHENPLDFLQVGDHTFVVGEAGDRYTIVLTNHTAHRFEAVTTVDGLDVINGKPGSVRNRGYLLLPFATIEIDGFRQSEETVAAFRFGRVKNSYAAKVGTARDVGVIGVAFFGEDGDRWVPWNDGEVLRRATATPFPGDSRHDDRFAPPPRW
jgi:hypothetical protein